jgi:hypothetical protein
VPLLCHPDEASSASPLVILTKRATRAAGRISDSFAPAKPVPVPSRCVVCDPDEASNASTGKDLGQDPVLLVCHPDEASNASAAKDLGQDPVLLICHPGEASNASAAKDPGQDPVLLICHPDEASNASAAKDLGQDRQCCSFVILTKRATRAQRRISDRTAGAARLSS